MMVKSSPHGLLDRVQRQPLLIKHGIKAVPVGKHSVRVSRNGRFLGLWQEMLGSIAWCPADPAMPRRHVLNADEAIRQLSHDLQITC
jgi:hypothetical protein